GDGGTGDGGTGDGGTGDGGDDGTDDGDTGDGGDGGGDDNPDGDDDEDGVTNENDQCPDTLRGADVDADGCEIITGGGGDGGDDGGGDGGGGGGGTVTVCGNGTVETGEECDPPDGTSCDDDCAVIEGADVNNDSCDSPASVTDGTSTFNTDSATTDGLDDPTRCVGDVSLIRNDIWYCYTATCNGLTTVGLCGSNFDTMVAVYAGCGCPAEDSALFCSDDNCGSTYLSSRLTFNAIQGEQYMIRIGGYDGAVGQGFLHIECGQPPGCPTDAQGECFVDGGNGSPGCNDLGCCNTVCGEDRYCCDVEWDGRCVREAEGFCNGAFDTCGSGQGCGVTDLEQAGCDDATCCQMVCEQDPICCLDMWDELCVAAAADLCGTIDPCGTATNLCILESSEPGCGDPECCAAVCDWDPVCCTDAWDDVCVQRARELQEQGLCIN
ncbi:MAG: hypothetical protein ACYTHJ_20485, partial [Planctomycetota bacterium]